MNEYVKLCPVFIILTHNITYDVNNYYDVMLLTQQNKTKDCKKEIKYFFRYPL